MTGEEVIQQYQKLHEPIRSEALEAFMLFPKTDVHISFVDKTLASAIDCISWGRTKQGGEYWKNIANLALAGEFDNPELQQKDVEYGVSMISISQSQMDEFNALKEQNKALVEANTELVRKLVEIQKLSQP